MIRVLVKSSIKKKIEALIQTLRGNNKQLLIELEQKMIIASEQLKFERAALYRNIRQNIKEIFSSRIKQFEYAKISSREKADDTLIEIKELLSLEGKTIYY